MMDDRQRKKDDESLLLQHQLQYLWGEGGGGRDTVGRDEPFLTERRKGGADKTMFRGGARA